MVRVQMLELCSARYIMFSSEYVSFMADEGAYVFNI